MSSSGLLYAVIVGAWAAYLVPMWLRRQDELNEARPTERFSTAIRLLSGKAAMERKYAKEAERRAAGGSGADGPTGDGGSEDSGGGPEGHAEGSARSGDDEAGESTPDTAGDAVDVRAFADPKTMVGGAASEAATEILPPSEPPSGEEEDPRARERRNRQEARARRDQRQRKRAQVLARRRRTTMLLFLAFTVGSVVAAVGGMALLWVPAVPAALLTAYIVHLRTQERRRFLATMDRRQAEAAAQRLRERRGVGRRTEEEYTERHERADQYAADDRPTQEHEAPPQRPNPRSGGRPSERGSGAQGAGRPAEHAPAPRETGAADRRALVEQTDHAEWVDQQRGRDRDQSEGEGWEPVPVPLPTYVSAPVAPRNPRGVDLEAPDTWSSARSSAAGAQPPATGKPASGQGGQSVQGPAKPAPEGESASRSRRPRERGRTPLFDQYEDEDRPRAANE
ncbi:hypothetical protein [Streptomyces sp. ODS28]|uniref:divisome protein SepX/GlpR n=1 Tax=Streptomyces sp. ODS28 TaxID=3136688 RepID=UPI0031E577CC